MSSLWQHMTLSQVSFPQWRSASYMHRLLSPLRQWRRSSWMLKWGEIIGAGLVTLVFAVSPFIPNSLIGVLLVACAAFWLLLTLSDEVSQVQPGETKPTAILSSPIHILATLYWVIAAVATVQSPVRRAAFEGFTKLTLYLVLFALMARVLRSPRIRSWVIAVYLHVALLVSVYGWQQKILGVKPLATWADPDSPLAGATRAYSYLGNPNLLAGYLVPAIMLSAVAFFAWRGILPKALALTMVATNVGCMLWTYSRGGWIGTLVGGFVLAFLLFHWWSVALPRFWRVTALPIVVGSLAGIVLLAVLFVEPLRDRVSSMFVGRGDSSNNFRINVWMSVIQMIKAHPILGIGPGNDAFNLVYPTYQRSRYSALSAYSIPLEIAVETGIIGLTCFIWLLTVTVHIGWVQLQQLRQVRSREGLWLIGAIASLFGMLSHGLVDTVWYRPQVNTLWWLMLALIASYYTAQPQTKKLNIAESSPSLE